MSFLSFAFMAALPLAAAPILLHFFDRRRSVVIEWGAMQFLMEAATRRTRARRLKQWLLLLLRVTACAALVLALARPMASGSWFGSSDRSELILVLDNSMSMMRANDDTVLFDQAVERAVQELGDLESGDYARVLLASPYPAWATAGSTRIDAASRGAMETRLREIRTTAGQSDLLRALFVAAQAEVQPTQQRRTIVLLTDGQSSDWRFQDEDAWKRLHDVLQDSEIPTDLQIVEIEGASQEIRNVSVTGIDANRTVVGVNQPVTLTARIRNQGTSGSQACPVTWSVADDQLQDDQLPPLQGGEAHDLGWKHSFSRTGVYAISCRVNTTDDLEPDNVATIVVEVVDQVPVLLVESAPDLAEIQQDAFFVQAALGWMNGDPLEEASVYKPTRISPDQLEQLDPADQRAVVIPNLKMISDEAVRALQDYVTRGGGLWIALGPRTDVEAFNEYLFADGSGLSPLALDRVVEEAAAASGNGAARGIKINPFLTDHPATRELADNEKLDTGDVSVTSRLRFVPPPEGEHVSVLLRLTNGQPLVVEKQFGLGRVVVQAIPLRLQWSDLTRSQAFVVMVQDWLSYLTQPSATRFNLAPGNPISFRTPDPAIRDATLTTPHGDEVELTSDTVLGGAEFRSSRTILPGDYVLQIEATGQSVPFHVSREPSESDLGQLVSSDHERLAELVAASGGTRESNEINAGGRAPLWSALLLTLLVAIAVEVLLAGRIARERFGIAAIEDTEDWGSEPNDGNPSQYSTPGLQSPGRNATAATTPLASPADKTPSNV